MPKSFGFLTIAIGEREYIEQAYYLAISLKYNMPNYPIAVVTDTVDEAILKAFDVVVRPEPSHGRGVRHKMYVDMYSPFEETLFIDSDCIVSKPFDAELGEIRRCDFSPVVQRYMAMGDTDEYFQNLPEVMRELNLTYIPKFNGGVYFFKKSDASGLIFSRAREIFHSSSEFGIKLFDGKDPGDESAYAIALANLSPTSLYMDRGSFMNTPLGLRGKMTIDPLGGGCSFQRMDGQVTPAICHFAGKYRLQPEYYLARLCLKNMVRVDTLSKLQKARAFYVSYHLRLMQFMKWKKQGFVKRLQAVNAVIGRST